MCQPKHKCNKIRHTYIAFHILKQVLRNTNRHEFQTFPFTYTYTLHTCTVHIAIGRRTCFTYVLNEHSHVCSISHVHAHIHASAVRKTDRENYESRGNREEAAKF